MTASHQLPVGIARICLGLLCLLWLFPLHPASADTRSESQVTFYGKDGTAAPKLALNKVTSSAVLGVTTRVSVASDGAQGNGSSFFSSVSTTGRYIAFYSGANNLVSGDTNVLDDVFIHDRMTGQTSRVSVASNGMEGNGISHSNSISASGRYVAFTSYASNLVSGDSNGWNDVFVRDRQRGKTTRVSVASDGTQGIDGGSDSPSISPNGRIVVFDSGAINLVNGDSNGVGDVFVRDRATAQTTRVSLASDGTQGDGDSGYGSISADLRYVSFQSLAGNLVSADTNEKIDIFVHDRVTGETTLVSVASDGTQGDSDSERPSISANGKYVVFDSDASNLASGDLNSARDIFVHDRVTGQTTRVSVASDGTEANGGSDSPSISANGQYVAFTSHASNLVSGDTNEVSDIFVHDRLTGQTTRISVASDGTEGNGYPNLGFVEK